jgi:peptide-methionine (S)-S-oxide reductase
MKGVESVVSGYAGGGTIDPTYEEIETGETGHSQVVKITFDESVIPAGTILDLFFLIHNPTTLNYQGHDIGTQYRSAMFYSDGTQKAAFEAAVERAKSHWDDPIVTQVSHLDTFYEAEEYHQDYFNRNPGNGYCSIVITPKIIKARSVYTKWFKES